jgi:HSP20 family protein
MQPLVRPKEVITRMANIMRKEKSGRQVAPSPLPAWEPLRMFRDLLQWDPFREMTPYASASEPASTFTPEFEVKETKDAYLFRADLPGVKEADLEITLTENRLSICGKREAEQKDEGETYYTYERSYGFFNRSFTLPEGVDASQAAAELKDGVLSLTLPKKPELQPKRIELKGKGEKEKEKAKA